MPPSDVTQLLNAWQQGDQQALERLTPLVEAELRRLARIYLVKEGVGHTLQPTALVNEAFLRLIGWQPSEWQNRAHFYAVAAKMMRRVLISQAVGRNRQKRGGTVVLVSLSEATPVARQHSVELIALDEALRKLAVLDDRKSQIVELKFFGGLSSEETAVVLGMSASTVNREWGLARAWLFRELRGTAQRA